MSLVVNNPGGWDGSVYRDTCHTPYRLSALNKPRQVLEDSNHKVWSRYGYEYYNNRPADVPDMVNKSPVQEVQINTRRGNVTYPSFNTAMKPPKQQGETRVYARDFLDTPFTSRSLNMRTDQHDYRYPEYDPSPTPIGRTYSIPKSRKSVQFSFGSPPPSLYFDKKGRRKAEGICSREFTVSCPAPRNWLRMKWGRSKTTLL